MTVSRILVAMVEERTERMTAARCRDSADSRPLFIGICGAVVFRLLFLYFAESEGAARRLGPTLARRYLMHSVWFMHLVFGMLLIVTRPAFTGCSIACAPAPLGCSPWSKASLER